MAQTYADVGPTRDDISMPKSAALHAWNAAFSKGNSAITVSDSELAAMMSLGEDEPSSRFDRVPASDPLEFLDRKLNVSGDIPTTAEAAAAAKEAEETADGLRMLGHDEDTIAKLTAAAAKSDTGVARTMRYPADLLARPGAAPLSANQRAVAGGPAAMAAASNMPREADRADVAASEFLASLPAEFKSPYGAGGGAAVTRREEDRLWEQGLFGRLVRGANKDLMARRPAAADRSKLQQRKASMLRAKLAQNNVNVHVQGVRLLMEEMVGDEGLACEESPIGQETPIYLFDYDRAKKRELEIFMHSIRTGVAFKKANAAWRAKFLEGVNPTHVREAYKREQETLTPVQVGNGDFYGVPIHYYYEFFSLRINELTPEVLQSVRDKLRPMQTRNARVDAWQRVRSSHKHWLRRVLHEPALPSWNESWKYSWTKEVDGDERDRLHQEHIEAKVRSDPAEMVKDAQVAAWREKGPTMPTALDRLHVRERAAVARMLAGEGANAYIKRSHKPSDADAAQDDDAGIPRAAVGYVPESGVDSSKLVHGAGSYQPSQSLSPMAPAFTGTGRRIPDPRAAVAAAVAADAPVSPPATAGSSIKIGSLRPPTVPGAAPAKPPQSAAAAAFEGTTGPSSKRPIGAPPTLAETGIAGNDITPPPNARDGGGLSRRRPRSGATEADIDARADAMLKYSTKASSEQRVSSTARWAAIQQQIDHRRDRVVTGLQAARAAAVSRGGATGSVSSPAGIAASAAPPLGAAAPGGAVLAGRTKATVIDLPPDAAPARTRNFRGKTRPNGHPYSRLQIAYITAAYTEAEAQQRQAAVDASGDEAIPTELRPEFLQSLRHKATLASRRIQPHEPRPTLSNTSAGRPTGAFGTQAARPSDERASSIAAATRDFGRDIVDAFGDADPDAATATDTADGEVPNVRAAAAASAWLSSPRATPGKAGTLAHPQNEEGLAKLQRLQASRALGQQRPGMGMEIAMAELQALLPPEDWSPAQAKVCRSYAHSCFYLSFFIYVSLHL